MARQLSYQVNLLLEASHRQESLKHQLLRAKLNPHFLYNTMDMISWLAQQGKSDEVTEVVRRLSRFYRLTLSRKQELTTIADEAEHVTIYIELQNMHHIV
mgnify:CR=1 FL=1